MTPECLSSYKNCKLSLVLTDFTPSKLAKLLTSTGLDDDFGFHMNGYILTSNKLNIFSCSSVGVLL